jgi:phage gp37-like protein
MTGSLFSLVFPLLPGTFQSYFQCDQRVDLNAGCPQKIKKSRNLTTQQSRNLATEQSRNLATQQSRNLLPGTCTSFQSWPSSTVNAINVFI